MERREFVTAAGFLGGISLFGWQLFVERSNDTLSTNGIGVATATPEPTPTEAPTPEAATQTPELPPTETSEPDEETQTPTETPTQAEQRAQQQLSQTEQALIDIVDLYTRGYGSELTDVTASSTDFEGLSTNMQIAFADAQDDYTSAVSLAANAEQRGTADRMQGCWQFLRQAIRTQEVVVEGYEHLDTIYDELERNNDSPAGLELDKLGTTRGRANRRYETLRNESTAEAASVIEPISIAEYENKLAQFEADITAYGDVEEPLRTIIDGVSWLSNAQSEMDKDERNVQTALTWARRAKDELRRGRSELNSMRNDMADPATIGPLLKSFASLVGEKIDEANAIINRF
ncbi:hypothetical protein [Salinigranum sp. GCM10025319]|uniref:hypothetical protein n=1 Tax=Salinigranum sp. GCM10025319 TaxID=3252687 RepID=UPI00360609FB